MGRYKRKVFAMVLDLRSNEKISKINEKYVPYILTHGYAQIYEFFGTNRDARKWLKPLIEKHTEAYLKQVIIKVLNEYNISPKQIYTVTSDNERNMIKCTKLLHNDLVTERDLKL